jgi:quercetin dioxygenase-like cupin family protein
MRSKIVIGVLVLGGCLPVLAQDAQPPARGGGGAAGGAAGGRGGRGGRGGGAAETWYVEKTKGGVYNPPMRPLWKLSELKQMHAEQNNWQEQVIKDPEQDATYNSGAPGFHFAERLHPDTPTVLVFVAGQANFTVEGQPPTTATRGSIMNIMKGTVFSFDVAGTQNALWVEVNPANYKTVFPTSGPAPTPKVGGQIVKVSFGHTPAPYTGNNKLMVNTFDDTIAGCKTGAAVLDDHIFASPLLGFNNPADNKCAPGTTGNIGSGPLVAGAPPFNPATTYGHMHAGPAEWWIVQVGQIRGQFENTGEFHAVEGDVLYAAPMMWHQMAAEAPSGPNVRLAMGGYQLINMGNTAGQP